jgi:tRNA modification GTPase
MSASARAGGIAETIAAIATPPGAGAIAIVRISGPDARAVADRVFRGPGPLRDRGAVFGRLVDARGADIDRGLAIYCAGPRSATGEDVVELHVHGSPVVARDALAATLAAGARMAHAGEFTRRAFENGKIDLSEAEAIGLLIAAEHRSEARAAAAGLAGGIAHEVARVRAELVAVIEDLAASLDFPDEVEPPEGSDVLARIEPVAQAVEALGVGYERGLQVRTGTSVAIVGPPNAGKSSLLNALLQDDRALVSAEPGTTRDTIEESLAIDGVRLRVVDTAGLRETSDPIERAGIERTRRALDASRIALVVIDGSQPLDAAARDVLAATRGRERIVLFNKRDAGVAGFNEREPAEAGAISGSAYENETIATVLAALRDAVVRSEVPDAGHAHLVTARQADAALSAARSLRAACNALQSGDPPDLCAQDLIAAIASLDAIGGRDASEAVLDGIFSRFCIGK